MVRAKCLAILLPNAGEEQGEREFGIREIKLTNAYVGVDRKGSPEAFFDHLPQHAVLLNENAIRQLRDPATAI